VPTRPPTVSVVLNSYNQAPYLREAIDSVLGQTFRDLELLVVDNGSSDASPDIARDAAERDGRVRLMLHDENLSITRRFNEAVAAARGEFVSFLLSDDFYLEHKLETQVARFARLGPEFGVVYGVGRGLNQLTGATWTYHGLEHTGEMFEALMLLPVGLAQIDMVTPLIRRTCLLQHRFNENVFSEGEAIFRRIALTHRFAHVGEPLAVLRDHLANIGKAIVQNRETNKTLLEALRRDPHLGPDQAPLVDRYEARLMASYGWQAARLGMDPSWTRARLREAVRLSPVDGLTSRTAGALLLSLLPRRARQIANRLGDRLRSSPVNAAVIDGYGDGLRSPDPL
jgi:glycosyltransferase involved in cell wall biosynthesis